MELEQIQYFFSTPQFADVIAYLLTGLAFLSQFFIKRFVKRDNYTTVNNVKKDVRELKLLENKLNETLKQNEEDKKVWAEEKKALLEELEKIKSSTHLIASNVKDLVKSGVANAVNKTLNVAEEKKIKEIIVEEVKDETSENVEG